MRYTRELDFTREEHIVRFVRALTNTSTSYRKGCMSKATWKDHMESLWGSARAKGVLNEVIEQVDPALVGLRPLSEQRIDWTEAA